MRRCLKGRGGFPLSNDGFILGLPHGSVGRLFVLGLVVRRWSFVVGFCLKI
jgi:hypothetical protein